jgi:GNAT superfamily N-acetyltransferase
MAELRTATADDAPAGHALMTEGFEHYRTFGVAGYRPPADPPEKFAERLAADGAWGVVAEAGGRIVGIGAFEPARTGVVEGELVPGLAHVFAIFVTEPSWGDGTATALLAAVHAEIARRGYAEARLFTPAPHGRGRRFYAREGWREVAEIHVEALGLDMVELRRPVG